MDHKRIICWVIFRRNGEITGNGFFWGGIVEFVHEMLFGFENVSIVNSNILVRELRRCFSIFVAHWIKVP